jgi:two-component system response regulator NreC
MSDAERADRTQTTVVIADDHTVVRHGLRMLIDNEDGLQVIAEAGTGPDAERLTRAHRPTVLVLDLNMPAARAWRRSRASRGGPRVVVLTMQDDPAFARQALQAGALGFVLKEAADEELLEAIRLAAAGDTYLNPRLGARMAARAGEPAGPPDDLTTREVDVLRLIALGHTNARSRAALPLDAHGRDAPRAHPAEAAPHARAPSSCATRSSTASSKDYAAPPAAAVAGTPWTAPPGKVAALPMNRPLIGV